MTPGVRVHVVMPPGLLERVDAARGDGQSRGDFVRRAVERALALPESGRLVSVSAEEPEDAEASERDARFESRTPAPAEQPTIAERRDAWELERRRVSPSGPASPRVPFRRDVKPFQRGGS